MKKNPALALLEFSNIAVGVSATDLLLKKAPVAALRCGTVTGGRFLTLIGGTTASVQESYREGLYWGGESIVDHLLLADVHPRLYAAIHGERVPTGVGALVIIETDSATASVRAAEAALKGTPVELLEIRLADTTLAGKGVAIYRGELHDIEAAVTLAAGVLPQDGARWSWKIISRPHEALLEQLADGTHFATSSLLDLHGEAD
jgi:microcompartment protein CcmL/EutN